MTMNSTHFNSHSTLVKSRDGIPFAGKFDEAAVNNLKTTTYDNNATRRIRRHSAGGRILKYATDPKQVVGDDSVPERAIQGAELNRRRKISLPNYSTVQCPENARIEIAKRDVNLDTYMPVFKGCEHAKRRTNAPKGLERELEWQLLQFEGNGSSTGVAEYCGGSNARGKLSLPVLKADRSAECDSAYRVPSRGLPSTSSVPRVRSGSLIGKKVEAQMWFQRQ